MFKIHEESPEEMKSSNRVDWPFKSLNVGQTVEMSKEHSELFSKARIAAHALASHNGWKFSTKLATTDRFTSSAQNKDLACPVLT